MGILEVWESEPFRVASLDKNNVKQEKFWNYDDYLANIIDEKNIGTRLKTNFVWLNLTSFRVNLATLFANLNN